MLLSQHKLAAGCTADLLLMRLRACRVYAPDGYHSVLHSVVCHGPLHSMCNDRFLGCDLLALLSCFVSQWEAPLDSMRGLCVFVQCVYAAQHAL